MYSLFIDTHSSLIRICLYKNKKVLDKIEIESIMHHSDYLMPNIKNILKNNNISIKNINEILVINGPGSFTGVRLGVAVAKMLAYTLNVNIKCMTSLDLFAYSNKNVNKVVSIPDVKGYYVGYYLNNKLIDNYLYLNKEEYNEFVSDKKNLLINNDVDYDLIYNEFLNKDCINAHIVNPIYIKQIEALK